MQRKESMSRNLNITSGEDEERDFITFKDAIHNEDITVMNACLPRNNNIHKAKITCDMEKMDKQTNSERL